MNYRKETKKSFGNNLLSNQKNNITNEKTIKRTKIEDYDSFEFDSKVQKYQHIFVKYNENFIDFSKIMYHLIKRFHENVKKKFKFKKKILIIQDEKDFINLNNDIKNIYNDYKINNMRRLPNEDYLNFRNSILQKNENNAHDLISSIKKNYMDYETVIFLFSDLNGISSKFEYLYFLYNLLNQDTILKKIQFIVFFNPQNLKFKSIMSSFKLKKLDETTIDFSLKVKKIHSFKIYETHFSRDKKMQIMKMLLNLIKGTKNLKNIIIMQEFDNSGNFFKYNKFLERPQSFCERYSKKVNYRIHFDVLINQKRYYYNNEKNSNLS